MPQRMGSTARGSAKSVEEKIVKHEVKKQDPQKSCLLRPVFGGDFAFFWGYPAGGAHGPTAVCVEFCDL